MSLFRFLLRQIGTGDQSANGLRLTQPVLNPQEPDFEIIQLKAKRVAKFTMDQQNLVMLKGATYDSFTKHLIVDLQYGGGCFPHTFALEWDGSTLESFPPQYHFNLVDLSKYDPCKALVPAQLRFDVDVPGIQLDVPSTVYIRTPSESRQLQVEIQ